MINPEHKEPKSLNFLEVIIEKDLEAGVNNKRVHTRFPPEPNGYLHIGHAKAICLNFGLAKKYNGLCNLRFDDTNPVKEDVEYVDSIKDDIRWLGFDWGDREYYASDYFQQLYDFAVALIKKGLAYVDEQSAETIAQQKGSPTSPGQESPFRNRPIEENIRLFEAMNRGDFDEGSCVLRAKIDMSSSNMHMRDPIMYRIMKVPHHRTGNTWKVYPMYDFAHGQSDFFEGITHSFCTLEFEVHRPLYEWFVDHLQTSDYRPKQREFNRLNINYTVMSKRKLLSLVQDGIVCGWDDPRMPTISGLRKRGYTPASIRNFVNRIGYTKVDGTIDISLLEHSAKEDLNATAPRVNAVLNPLKVVITNYEGDEEYLEAINNPEDESMGTRQIPFSKEIYIEREDFMENPPKKYFRLAPGVEVRLKNAYFICCNEVIKNDEGEIVELHCTYDPTTKSGTEGRKRKVKGTLHWVSVKHAINAEVRLYDRLFNVENPDGDKDVDYRQHLNTASLKVLKNCKVEPSLATAKALDHFQFQRLGYFNIDPDSSADRLVFNRTVRLTDGWKPSK